MFLEEKEISKNGILWHDLLVHLAYPGGQGLGGPSRTLLYVSVEH